MKVEIYNRKKGWRK